VFKEHIDTALQVMV